jgi:hypothetical protein
MVAMRRGLFVIGLFVGGLCGCAAPPWWTAPPATTGTPVAVLHENPMFLPITDHELVWETVVDVVDDYFTIRREEPVRLIGDTLAEGWLDTLPSPAATVFEPWHLDSVGLAARTESTLQSIRRWAMVQVIPAEGGYWVDVAVFKELEDVRRPEHATAGAATLRYDGSLTRVIDPMAEQEINEGWIPQGRDAALQQRILSHLLARSAEVAPPMYAPLIRGNYR